MRRVTFYASRITLSVVVMLYRNRTSKMCVCIPQLRRLASPESVAWARGLETRRKGHVADEVQRLSAGRIPSCWEEVSLFVLFKPSTEQIRPTHMREGGLLYSMSTCLNVKIPPRSNTLIETASKIVDQIDGHCGLTKSQKISNHKYVDSALKLNGKHFEIRKPLILNSPYSGSSSILPGSK